MTTSVPTGTFNVAIPARRLSGPPWPPVIHWQGFWRLGAQQQKWRRTAAMLLRLDSRIARDMGFEPEALRYAIEQGWTEAQARHYSRSDV